MHTGNNHPDPDDMFSDTRMTFGEHIEDLRSHLLRAIYGFVIAVLASLFIAKPVLYVIAAPVEQQLGVFYDRYNAERAREIQKMLDSNAFENQRPTKLTILLPIKELREVLGLAPKTSPVLEKVTRAYDSLLLRLGVADLVNYEEIPGADLIRVGLLVPNIMELVPSLQTMNNLMRPPRLSTLSVQEAFIVYFKVALLTGLVLASPWVFYQIWSFIAAGLYPHEKKLVNIYLPFSLGLFLTGVLVCQFIVLPKAIAALLWFNEWLGLQPDLRLNEWLGFAIFMPLVFGISFQTPLVMMFVNRIGLFDVESFRNKRRMAWFVMAIFSAVITPSTDAFSMLFLLVPMGLLYELGIWLCTLSPPSSDSLWESSESEEMIEV
ncbi:MAG: twin-arginine translocase subunit TatC [Gemmataceae bacterium]|nr:twin-arginine translocase subunit TatC [Gemmataceae bacterium]